MKAIQVCQFGPPSVMRYQEFPELSAGPGEVVVTLKAAGVNPVDTYIRSGKYPGIHLPYTPGIDGAGIIKKFGSGVREFTIGDRVFVSRQKSGSYAQEMVCSIDEIFPLDENLSYSQGAAIGIPYATAWLALFDKAKAFSNETVLIHGASGGVGTAAVQLAKNAGLTVFGTAGTLRGLDLIRQLGADFAFNHTQSDYQKTILNCTSGRGMDIILEVLANVNLSKDLDLVAKNGRIIVVGSRGNVDINPRRIMQKEAVVSGFVILNKPREDLKKIYTLLTAEIKKGKIMPVVSKEFLLNEAPQAHEALMQPGAYGKIVLLP